MAAWRLAPLACRQRQDTPPPGVSVDARLALRDGLDHALLRHSTAPAPSGAAPRKGVREAQEPSQPPPAAGGAALAPSNRLAAASRVTTPAVPRPHGAAAHGPGAWRPERGASPCVSRAVRPIGPVPLTSLSARPALRKSVATRQANGAHMPERTGLAPWAVGQSSSAMTTEAVGAQDAKRAQAVGRSWPPCVRGVSGVSSRGQRPAWRGTTVTGTS
jgi:hypothetical protein